MAVLVERENLLFIGNMRTGSTAIGQTLESQLGGRYVPADVLQINGERISKRHATIDQLVKYDLIPDPKGLLKFVFVRNPFDSLVSRWQKQRSKPRYADSVTARLQLDFPAWFDRFVTRKPPQSMHAKFVEGTDEVLRFETLAPDLDSFMQRAGVKAFEVPLINVTPDRTGNYRDYYSTETRRIVEDKYAEDLETYEYVF